MVRLRRDINFALTISYQMVNVPAPAGYSKPGRSGFSGLPGTPYLNFTQQNTVFAVTQPALTKCAVLFI